MADPEGEMDSDPGIPSFELDILSTRKRSLKEVTKFLNSTPPNKVPPNKRHMSDQMANRESKSAYKTYARISSSVKTQVSRKNTSSGCMSDSRGFYGKKTTPAKEVTANKTPNRIYRQKSSRLFDASSHDEDQSVEDVDIVIKRSEDDQAPDSEGISFESEEPEEGVPATTTAAENLIGISPTTAISEGMPAAFKEITGLLTTVVKRMDRMENELKSHISSVSSSSSKVRTGAKFKTSIPLIVKVAKVLMVLQWNLSY